MKNILHTLLTTPSERSSGKVGVLALNDETFGPWDATPPSVPPASTN